jgi:hypothetical protein
MHSPKIIHSRKSPFEAGHTEHERLCVKPSQLIKPTLEGHICSRLLILGENTSERAKVGSAIFMTPLPNEQ